eukprot:1590607-Ditylum_brightwellii.AAC.1
MTAQRNTDVAPIIKDIWHCKEVKQSFKLLQPLSKGNQVGVVSAILVPEESGWVPIENDTKVMLRLLRRNQLHLHQTWDSSFVSCPLKEYIGDYGLGSSAQDILDGNFDPNVANNLSAENFWLRHHIRCMTPSNSITVDLTLDDYKELIKC